MGYSCVVIDYLNVLLMNVCCYWLLVRWVDYSCVVIDYFVIDYLNVPLITCTMGWLLVCCYWLLECSIDYLCVVLITRVLYWSLMCCNDFLCACINYLHHLRILTYVTSYKDNATMQKRNKKYITKILKKYILAKYHTKTMQPYHK